MLRHLRAVKYGAKLRVWASGVAAARTSAATALASAHASIKEREPFRRAIAGTLG
jgi:hypothetical protein